MRIEEYHFGYLRTREGAYSRDVVIGKKIYPNWWRKEGHELCWEDLEPFLEAEKPEVVVVGCGAHGVMRVLPEVETKLAERGIALIAENTPKAVEIFNSLVEQGSRRVLGAFHLTC